MKRDPEIIREVLLATEAYEKPTGWIKLDLPGRDADDVSYHVKLLSEAGYLHAQNLTTHTSFCWMPKGLTWKGHEFLDAIRNDNVWQKTKETVKDKLSTLPLDLLKDVATKVAASMLGLG